MTKKYIHESDLWQLDPATVAELIEKDELEIVQPYVDKEVHNKLMDLICGRA